MTTALLLIAVLVLVLLNGFFVAAEFAFVRARSGYLEKDAKAGRKGAAQARGDHRTTSRATCRRASSASR